MMKKFVTFLIVSVLIFTSGAVAEKEGDDENYFLHADGTLASTEACEYSVLAVGDYYALSDLTFEDANAFDRRFSGIGWTRIQYEKDANVQYWDFYDYGTDLEADQGDFLYFMGHGWSSTVSLGETIYSPLGLQGFKYYDNSHSRSYVNPSRIGYNANSKWDDDLEWFVIGACSTLANNGSATRWGQTLYNGMHGLFGYKATAHGMPDDEKIANHFMNFATGAPGGLGFPTTVYYSWEFAHWESDLYYDDNPYIWAIVMHSNNKNDYLHGYSGSYGSGATPDVRGSISDVKYYDLDNSSGISLFSASSTSLDEPYIDGILKMTVKLPEKKKIKSIQPKDITLDINNIAQKIFGKQMLFTQNQENEYICRENDKVLKKNNLGGIQYYKLGEIEKVFTKTEDAARKIAEDFLKNNIKLPADAELAKVHVMRSIPLFDEKNQPLDNPTPEILGYVFEYRHKIGEDLLAGNEKILVSVREDGVEYCLFNWHEFSATDTGKMSISSEEAYEEFKRIMNKIYEGIEKPIEVIGVDFVYVCRHDADSFDYIPVWRFSYYEPDVDSKIIRYFDVNAETGKNIYGYN